MSFSKLQNYYNRLLKEAIAQKEAIEKADDYDDALKEASEEGHSDDDAHSRAEEIMAAIERKNEYKEDMEVQKATYARRDTFALASYLVTKIHGITDFSEGSRGKGLRNWYAQQIDKKHGPGSKGSKDSYYEGATAPPKPKTEKMIKSTPLQKLSSSLANLMSAAAGWALSDDIVRAGGGSP